MAFGDGHLSLALAHILHRGQHLAMQPGQLSISPFGGPEPLAFPCQQLPIMLDSSSAEDLFWDADCQFSATSMDSTPCSPSCWAPVNKLTACAASPGSSTRSCSSCVTPAQRSLAAALNVPDSPAAAAPAAAAGQAEADTAAQEDGCSTPRAQMIPAVRPPPGAPRAPRPAARALLPDRSSGLLRAHAGETPAGPPAPAFSCLQHPCQHLQTNTCMHTPVLCTHTTDPHTFAHTFAHTPLCFVPATLAAPADKHLHTHLCALCLQPCRCPPAAVAQPDGTQALSALRP
jgi:hypothetical protein